MQDGTLDLDFIVTGVDGRPIVLGEIRRETDVDERWANEYRQNLSAMGPVHQAEYFMLVCPDRTFLWNDAWNLERKPICEISTASYLEPILDAAGYTLADANESLLQFAVREWLGTLIDPKSSDLSEAETKWIREIGLDQAIKGGSVELGLPSGAW